MAEKHDDDRSTPAIRGGGLEEAVLRAVMHRRGDGYAVTLKPDVEAAIGKNLTYGGIYTTLDRLTEKGFVEPTWGESTPERGGRRRQYFHITGAGQRALSDAEVARERMREAFRGGVLRPEGGIA
jgi:DNA-binding PadR family transcriptional regulator